MTETTTQHFPNDPSEKETNWMTAAWRAISQLGITAADSTYFSRKVELTNQVAFIVFAIALVLTGGFAMAGSPKATVIWFLLLLITVWTVPFLNYLGNRTLSRHVLSTAIPLFSVIFVAHIRAEYPETVHEASFYVPRYFQMALSFLPLILFGFEERKHLFIAFFINVGILLFYNEIMDAMHAGMGVAEPAVNDPFFISVSSVLGVAIISTGYFFLNKLNQEYEVQIETLLAKTREQNRNMQDAIEYAKHIQKVVLPKDNILARLKDRLFVLYRPLHTVSGDFYMVDETEEHICFAVIDCTGHGVPGAFMSILASSALQRAIQRIGHGNPAQVMELVNRYFHEDINRSGAQELRDGMDMVLCSYDKQTGMLHVAGANLFVHIVSNGNIEELRTDKGGISSGNPDRTFTPFTVPLKKNDHVYISSDGFYDQFGGERDKRMGRARFRNKLEEVASLAMEDQHAALNEFFDQWKGSSFQVDDVCLIGFRA